MPVACFQFVSVTTASVRHRAFYNPTPSLRPPERTTPGVHLHPHTVQLEVLDCIFLPLPGNLILSNRYPWSSAVQPFWHRGPLSQFSTSWQAAISLRDGKVAKSIEVRKN